MAFLFANNINTTLAAAATSTQTTFSLTSTVGIPTTIPSGDYFAMTLNDAATRSVFEVVYVTAVSGSNVTVLRGQEGTTANSWLSGDYIYGALTAGEISDFAFVSGNSAQPFAVAAASASAPQNAPQFGQMFDLQSPSASVSITLSALRTIVIPTATAAITLTMQPGTTAGQWCEIVGTASGVTVQSSASSGSPYFAMPDGSVPYSFTLSSAGASLVLIWDGTNWRVSTGGQTVIADAASGNQAVALGQANGLYMPIGETIVNTFNGRNGAVSLSSGDVTNALTYIPAEVNGSSSEQFNVANATSASEAVNLGQFTSSLSSLGWIELPNGIILQWGTGTVTAGGTGNASSTVTLPEAFTTTAVFAIGNWGGSNPPGGGSAFPFTALPDTSQVSLGIYAPGAGTFVVAYLVIGR